MLKYIIYLILLVFTISCNKESSTGPTIGHDPNLFGAWILTTAKINGEIIDSTQYDDIPVKMVFNADGSGMFMEESGSSESIAWYTSGSQLRIDDEVDINYLIVRSSLTLSMTDTIGTIELNYGKEAEKEYDSALIGTWELASVTINGAIVDSNAVGDIPVRLFFDTSGSGTLWDDTGSESFTWHTSGQQLTIDGEDVLTYVVSNSILKLTFVDVSDQIELSYTKLVIMQ